MLVNIFFAKFLLRTFSSITIILTLNPAVSFYPTTVYQGVYFVQYYFPDVIYVKCFFLMYKLSCQSRCLLVPVNVLLCHHCVKFKNVEKNYSWTPCQFFFSTGTRIEHNKICQKHNKQKKKNLCEVSSSHLMYLQTNIYVYKSYFVQTIKTNKDILII